MSDPEPHFARVPGTGLFWLSATDRTIGFQCSSDASLPDNPSLSQTWGDTGGTFLFLAQAPDSDATFASVLSGYLATQSLPHGARFLWLSNPNASVATWVGQTLSVVQQVGWQVSRRADFLFSSYSFSIPVGATVALAPQAQDWGFVLSGGTFFAPGDRYPAMNSQVNLPLAGPVPGCWRFDIELPNGGNSPTDFERLQTGIRFFYPDNPNPSAGDVFVRALELPTLLQPAGIPLILSAALDVLRPTIPARTHLSFPAASPLMNSNFVTACGYRVSLTPLPASGNRPDARLVFAEHPRYVSPDGSSPKDFYLTFDGAFLIGWGEDTTDAAGDDIRRLLCGASGLDYVGLAAGSSSQLIFLPGHPAYASLAPSSSGTGVLSDHGTTAWIYPANVTGAPVNYYAQPEDAPLYWSPPPTPKSSQILGTTFLDFLEIPAAILAPSDGNLAFPVAPYFGLPSDSVEAALVLEARALAPARRAALLDAGLVSRQTAGATAKIGVTPQGIAVGIGDDGMEWTWAGIGNDSGPSESEPSLKFTKVTGAFRQALQTNRLFLVLANADVFATAGSVAYQLTASGLAEIAAEGSVPPAVLSMVQSAFAASNYPIFNTEDLFVAALLAAAPDAAAYQTIFERKSGLLAPKIGEWRFQMSPRNWTNPKRQQHQNALVLFKFTVDRSLSDLAADAGSWSWPEAGALPGGTIADTQSELRKLFQEAEDADQGFRANGRQSPYANIVNILHDPAWTGILAFNVEVPLAFLPEPLQVLAAGIDPSLFYAHHVGFSATPFGADPGVLQFGETSTFGLIDYQDPVDQSFSSDVYFAFKVLELTVGFQNSVTTDFSSRVELLINRLFGVPARLYPTEHGNNVILHGVYQRQLCADNSQTGTYVFSMSEQNTLQLEGTVLQQVVLQSASLVNDAPASLADPAATVRATFQFGGDLLFSELPGFDLFSFGASADPAATGGNLRFGNLGVQMELTPATRATTFRLIAETLTFDMANSVARPKSLFAMFPLRLSSFLAMLDPALMPAPPPEEQKPESLGYVTVGAPIQQTALTAPWYGLVFEIDLGTLGALTSNSGLTLRVLAAWSGGGTDTEPAIYLGVRMPGVKDMIGVELPLEGVLTLGFRTIQFVVQNDAATGKREYMLRFRNFALRILGFTFPPGYNDLYLVGNPDQSSPTKLAWYGAYSADADKKKSRIVPRAALRNAARRLTTPLQDHTI